MMYIISVKAESVKDIIQVDGELGVAEYFLTKDDGSTIPQRILFAIFSDYILNLLFALFGKNLRNMYLNYAYKKLINNMSPLIMWGDEKLVKLWFEL